MNKFARWFAVIIAAANQATPVGLVALALVIVLVAISILAVFVLRFI